MKCGMCLKDEEPVCTECFEEDQKRQDIDIKMLKKKLDSLERKVTEMKRLLHRFGYQVAAPQS